MAATLENPICHACHGELKRFTTNKPGPNQGRVFYTCKGSANGGDCKLERGVFVWETNDPTYGTIKNYVDSFNKDFANQLESSSSQPSSSSSSYQQKRPRVEPASSVPRQERHVTQSDLDSARLLVRMDDIERKLDLLIALIRQKLEDEEPSASQAQ